VNFSEHGLTCDPSKTLEVWRRGILRFLVSQQVVFMFEAFCKPDSKFLYIVRYHWDCPRNQKPSRQYLQGGLNRGQPC